MAVSQKQARKKLQKQMAASEKARRWLAWRHKHAETLSLLQIPEVYLKCEEHWHDFLTHGRLHLHSDIDEDATARAYDVSSLSVEQARAFFELIRDDYPDGWSNADHVIHCAFKILEKRQP